MPMKVLPELLQELEVGVINATHFKVQPVRNEKITKLINETINPVVALEFLPEFFTTFPIQKLDDWSITRDTVRDFLKKDSVRMKILSKYLPSLHHRKCTWYTTMKERGETLEVLIVAGDSKTARQILAHVGD